MQITLYIIIGLIVWTILAFLLGMAIGKVIAFSNYHYDETENKRRDEG